MQYTLTVECGEKTCAKVDAESGKPELCPFVQIINFGAHFNCSLFPQEQPLVDCDGWLMRSDECLKALQKVAA